MRRTPSSFRCSLVLFSALWTVAGAASDPCLEVGAPGAVQLPDGRQFEARSVRLCQANPFTPATSIVEVRIDGVSVGRFLAEIRSSAATQPTDTAFVTFDRVGATRPYRLVSLTLSKRDAAVSLRLRRTFEPAIAGRSTPGGATPVEIVTLAARSR